MSVYLRMAIASFFSETSSSPVVFSILLACSDRVRPSTIFHSLPLIVTIQKTNNSRLISLSVLQVSEFGKKCLDFRHLGNCFSDIQLVRMCQKSGQKCLDFRQFCVLSEIQIHLSAFQTPFVFENQTKKSLNFRHLQ